MKEKMWFGFGLNRHDFEFLVLGKEIVEYGRYVEMAQKVIEGYMSHVKSYALEIEVAHFQNGSNSQSRVFLLRWLTF